MTPKEKAQELLDKMSTPEHIDVGSARYSALIAVDEIIKAIDWHDFETPNKQFEYWQEVNRELETL